MKDFKSPFKLYWWQIALYEVALISLGIVIGNSWPDLWHELNWVLIALFAIGAGYMWNVWWKQLKETDSTE